MGNLGEGRAKRIFPPFCGQKAVSFFFFVVFDFFFHTFCVPVPTELISRRVVPKELLSQGNGEPKKGTTSEIKLQKSLYLLADASKLLAEAFRGIAHEY